MTMEEYIKQMLGAQSWQIAGLASALDEARKKIAELEAALAAKTPA